jgi:hypothetical protein
MLVLENIFVNKKLQEKNEVKTRFFLRKNNKKKKRSRKGKTAKKKKKKNFTITILFTTLLSWMQIKKNIFILYVIY